MSSPKHPHSHSRAETSTSSNPHSPFQQAMNPLDIQHLVQTGNGTSKSSTNGMGLAIGVVSCLLLMLSNGGRISEGKRGLWIIVIHLLFSQSHLITLKAGLMGRGGKRISKKWGAKIMENKEGNLTAAMVSLNISMSGQRLAMLTR